jgi:hypothetical protein
LSSIPARYSAKIAGSAKALRIIHAALSLRQTASRGLEGGACHQIRTACSQAPWPLRVPRSIRPLGIPQRRDQGSVLETRLRDCCAPPELCPLNAEIKVPCWKLLPFRPTT